MFNVTYADMNLMESVFNFSYPQSLHHARFGVTAHMNMDILNRVNFITNELELKDFIIFRMYDSTRVHHYKTFTDVSNSWGIGWFDIMSTLFSSRITKSYFDFIEFKPDNVIYKVQPITPHRRTLRLNVNEATEIFVRDDVTTSQTDESVIIDGVYLDGDGFVDEIDPEFNIPTIPILPDITIPIQKTILETEEWYFAPHEDEISELTLSKFTKTQCNRIT